MATIRVQVTQADIDNGETSATTCPVARAIRRATGGYVHVTGTQIHIEGPSGFHLLLLSEDVADAIARFDKTGYMEPFEFNLEVQA